MALLLAEFVTHGLGEVMISPADIQFSDRDLIQPDVFVAPLVEGQRPRAWGDIRSLCLAVEILSPSTARHDRLTKRRLYQQQEIEYWILDLDARVVERWLPGSERPEILAERLEWQLDPGRPPLIVDLEQLFRRVWGE